MLLVKKCKQIILLKHHLANTALHCMLGFILKTLGGFYSATVLTLCISQLLHSKCCTVLGASPMCVRT